MHYFSREFSLYMVNNKFTEIYNLPSKYFSGLYNKADYDFKVKTQQKIIASKT
jgi:hypothetical protein